MRGSPLKYLIRNRTHDDVTVNRVGRPAKVVKAKGGLITALIHEDEADRLKGLGLRLRLLEGAEGDDEDDEDD